MIVSSLKIQNWRNYDYADIELASGINLILGDNAEGKTNLLEAIYLCSIGRSARTPRDKELIRWGNTQATIRERIVKRVGERTIDIVIDAKVNKRVAIDSIPISRMGDLMGESRCVLFSPDEMRIIKESPSERRRFVDIALCQISKVYFYTLSEFGKILAQRNKLLKLRQGNDDTLDVWDMQLVNVGAKLIKSRRGFVRELNKYAHARHMYLTDNKESFEIEYEGIAQDDINLIRQEFLARLKKDRDNDIRTGYTHTGPHKDDLCIRLNGVDVRTYGSQGQQRTASLSLKLAELDILTNSTGESPVLLLDDVLNELDINRCRKLLSAINNVQTIITATHVEAQLQEFLQTAKVFVIKNSEITLARL